VNSDYDAGSGDLETLRDETIDALTDAYARDILTTEDFEKRVSRANEASTAGELEDMLAGIPGRPRPGYGSGAGAEADETLPEEPRPGGFAGMEDTTVALLSKRTFRPPADRGQSNTVAFMGTLVVDLRDVEPSRRALPIHIVGIMSDVSVLLPPDAEVDNKMLSILTDVKDQAPGRSRRREGRPGRRRGARTEEVPRIRLEGVCLMSDVKIVAD